MYVRSIYNKYNTVHSHLILLEIAYTLLPLLLSYRSDWDFCSSTGYSINGNTHVENRYRTIHTIFVRTIDITFTHWTISSRLAQLVKCGDFVGVTRRVVSSKPSCKFFFSLIFFSFLISHFVKYDYIFPSLLNFLLSFVCYKCNIPHTCNANTHIMLSYLSYIVPR